MHLIQCMLWSQILKDGYNSDAQFMQSFVYEAEVLASVK
jgi:hypothetical protein